MSKIIKGQPVQPIQRKRFCALGGYVFGALGINGEDVGTMKNMVDLVNDVFEAGIAYDAHFGRMIDQMWGYVTGLTKSQRKKLRNKNLHKVPYPMKGAMGAKRQARLDHASYHDPKNVAARKAKDVADLEAMRAVAPAKVRRKKSKAPAVSTKEEFYKSWEWRTLRMEVLKEHGRACQCCGAEPGMKDAAGDPVRICVDHIKPLSKFWHLRLDRKNLQVLCDECNQGKGNWDQTDFRPASGHDEWIVETGDVSPIILEQLSIHGETIQ